MNAEDAKRFLDKVRMADALENPERSFQIKPSIGLFAVCDPDGVIVHTTIGTTPQEAIDFWMEIEASMNEFANLCRSLRGERARCFSSWEQFEAEGYRIVSVTIISGDHRSITVPP